MPFEHSSVLIAVALDGIGRHLWLSCKGETPIEDKLIGSFQDLKLTKKGEYTLKKKCIQSGFPLQKPKAFRRYTHLLFFQDGGNFEYFSTSQENVVHVLVEDYIIK